MSDKSISVARPADLEPNGDESPLGILLACNGWQQAADGHLMVTLDEDDFREFVAAYRERDDLRTLLIHVSDVLCAVAFTVDDERLLTLNDEVIAGLMVKDSA